MLKTFESAGKLNYLMVCVFILQNEGGGKHQVTLGNEEADKLLYFRKPGTRLLAWIRLGKFRNIDDLIQS